MNAKRQYAKALKKLREIEEIAPEVAIIHHYVCELRKPRVEIRTVETRDDTQIHELETKLVELSAKCKTLEKQHKFEKGQPKYPRAPELKDQQAVFKYVKQMTTEGLSLIKGSGSADDFWKIIDALLVRTVNSGGDLLCCLTNGHFAALPSRRQESICEDMHDALVQCLRSQVEGVRQSLKQSPDWN